MMVHIHDDLSPRHKRWGRECDRQDQRTESARAIVALRLLHADVYRPRGVSNVVRSHPRECYKALLEAAKETLFAYAKDPEEV